MPIFMEVLFCFALLLLLKSGGVHVSCSVEGKSTEARQGERGCAAGTEAPQDIQGATPNN